MNNYCGFIEAYAGQFCFDNSSVITYSMLDMVIESTRNLKGFRTVAIFKIKLKTNEQQRNKQYT